MMLFAPRFGELIVGWSEMLSSIKDGFYSPIGFETFGYLHYALASLSVFGFLLATCTDDLTSDSLKLSWIMGQLLPCPLRPKNTDETVHYNKLERFTDAENFTNNEDSNKMKIGKHSVPLSANQSSKKVENGDGGYGSNFMASLVSALFSFKSASSSAEEMKKQMSGCDEQMQAAEPSTKSNEIHRLLLKMANGALGRRFRSALSIYASAAEAGVLLLLLRKQVVAVVDAVKFYLQVIRLKHISQSRRQFFYLVQKFRLGLVCKRESEIETYVVCKQKMKDLRKWPFMLEVNNVKDVQIICNGQRAYPMSSYSYLDFVRESSVQEAAVEAARQWSTGAHSARMQGGNSLILRKFEKVVGAFFGREDSLVCATGFLATMSAVCAFATKGDLIIADGRVHASLRYGITISCAKPYFFKHNDTKMLGKLLSRHRRKYRQCWIVIESVYSMEGTIADLPVIKDLALKYDAKIILDEAHGLGVLGPTGRGLEEHFNMPLAADVVCGTFSKSIAGVGGFITCNKTMLDFLDFHAPGNVFSAPLTAYSAGGALKAFELMQSTQQWRIRKAQENSKLLRSLLETGAGKWPDNFPEERKYELEGVSCTTILPVVFPDDPDRVFRVTVRLLDMGFFVAAAAFPACALRRPRIRVTATAAYTPELMRAFVEALVEATVAVGPTDEVKENVHPKLKAWQDKLEGNWNASSWLQQKALKHKDSSDHQCNGICEDEKENTQSWSKGSDRCGCKVDMKF